MSDVITITINGEAETIPRASTLADLLKQTDRNPKYLAVERNQALVPRKQHGECVLQDGDALEIVTLVGGG